MLTPQGAIKFISRAKSSWLHSGTNQGVLTTAYQAADAAASRQRRLGLPPFLVHASYGPEFSTSEVEVHTTPLGYPRDVDTEQVGPGVGVV